MKNGVKLGSWLAAMLLSFALIPATGPGPRADEPGRKAAVGNRVVQKFRAFSLRMGEGGIERKVPLDIWCVEKVDGPNVLVRAEKLGFVGWTLDDQVIDKASSDFERAMELRIRATAGICRLRTSPQVEGLRQGRGRLQRGDSVE